MAAPKTRAGSRRDSGISTRKSGQGAELGRHSPLPLDEHGDGAVTGDAVTARAGDSSVMRAAGEALCGAGTGFPTKMEVPSSETALTPARLPGQELQACQG